MRREKYVNPPDASRAIPPHRRQGDRVAAGDRAAHISRKYLAAQGALPATPATT